MNTVTDDLVALLQLERLEVNLFRGQSQDLGWGNIFGGQVLGQALSAARQTVPADRVAHSMHGYFLRLGDALKPVIYEVATIRDGRSFTTRRVLAIQNGAEIFTMVASFQVTEGGFDHQIAPPEVPLPDQLVSEAELSQAIADQLPAKLRVFITSIRPIEIRPVQVTNPLTPSIGVPARQLWYRAAAPLPDDPGLHQQLLAYASDFHLLGVALQPHAASWLTPGMHMASLDHAIWFHRPFRMDEWLLYSVDSPSAGGARGLTRGQFFDTAGRLVASTAQEGLIRKRG